MGVGVCLRILVSKLSTQGAEGHVSCLTSSEFGVLPALPPACYGAWPTPWVPCFYTCYAAPLSRLFRWSSRCFCFFLRARCNSLPPAVLCLLDASGRSGALRAVAVACSVATLIGSSAVACTARALAFTIRFRIALRRPFACILFRLYGARSTSNGFLAAPVLPSV